MTDELTSRPDLRAALIAVLASRRWPPRPIHAEVVDVKASSSRATSTSFWEGEIEATIVIRRDLISLGAESPHTTADMLAQLVEIVDGIAPARGAGV